MRGLSFLSFRAMYATRIHACMYIYIYVYTYTIVINHYVEPEIDRKGLT